MHYSRQERGDAMYEDGSIIIDSEIRTDGMEPGTKEVEQAIRSMSDTVKKMGIDTQMALQKQINAVSRMNSQYAQQEKKIDEIRKKMAGLAGKQIETSEYKRLGEELRQLEAQFSAVEQKETEWRQMGIPVDSAGYQALEKELDDIYFKMERVQQKQAQMRTGGTAYVDQTGTQQYLGLQNQLFAAEARLSDMNNRLGTSYTALKQGIGGAHAASAQLQTIFSSSVSPLQKVKGILGVLKRQLLGTDKAQKKVTESNRRMNKGLNNTSKSAGRARMSMGRMMAGALTISLAMRALMTVMAGFGEGMNNLVQYSDDSNRAISALMSGMTQLKNTFATAFSPLIEYVQPALSKFINLLAEAVTWTAQFFAALTGKDTFVKAVKVQQDYAESLDKTKEETKDAAKETQKALAPFDELIQIIRTKTDTSDSSDKNELKPEDMFTTEEVTNQVKGQAQAIKDIFSKFFEPLQKSWSEHGEYAVSASRAAFDSLKQLAKDIGASFMQVWNDEGYGEVISGNLIVTFGNLAYAVANLTRQFDEAWVKADNGTNIIRHLGDILVTMSDFFRRASEEIRDWAAELDFEPLLKSFDNVLVKMNPVVKKIGELLLWLLKNILLPLTKWALECGVPAVLELIAAGLELLASVVEAFEPLAMWLWETFLQPFGEWAGEVVIKALEMVVKLLKQFSDWISSHQEDVQYMTEIVIAFFAAWKFIEFVQGITSIIKVLSASGGLIGVLSILAQGLANVQWMYLGVAGAISTLLVAVFEIARNWDKMSPKEKVISGILAAAAAVGVLAVALGAVKGAAGAAVVAAALIAGIGAATVAINAGKRQVESLQASAGTSSYRSASAGTRSYSVPHLATGTVVPPRAGEFLAVLGDNKRETEVVSPLSTMKQAMIEALEAYGGMGGGNNRQIQVDMYLDRQRLGRVVYELNNQEKQRVGVKLVTEG